MASSQAVVARAMSGMKGLVALQLFTRILNFLIGLLVTERALRDSPGVVGIGNSQLLLLLSIALFWTREGFRKACIRGGQVDAQALVNVSWLTAPIGVVVSLVASYAFLSVSTEAEFAVPHFSSAVWLTGVAAIVELLSEPLFIQAQNLLLFKLRNGAETAAVLARTFVLALLILRFQMGILAYGYAQLAYGVVTTSIYYAHFASSGRIAASLPRRLRDGRWLDMTLVREVGVFTSQSLLKWLLTEGERLILKFSVSLSAQDVFSIINNLGSLVARCLFQPIEEVSFAMFSRLAQRMATEARVTAQVLRTLTTLMVTIGLVFACFGPSYSALLLDILYRGSLRNTDAAVCLAAYCVYVLLMAVNGVTEGFVYAVAPAADITFLNRLLVCFSLIYVTCATVFLRLVGPAGLIVANCVNMALRIAWNAHLIERCFARHREAIALRQAHPSRLPLLAFALSVATTAASARLTPPTLVGQALHVGTGAVCLLVALGVSWRTDTAFWREAARLVRNKAD